MKPLLMILTACAMATAACGGSAMPAPNDPATRISASAAPLPERSIEPQATAGRGPSIQRIDIATKPASN
ncbi:MAG: hypothetical protein ABI332_01415 [Polyangiaceae bacterium]